MKDPARVDAVRANNHKRVFEVRLDDGDFDFPFALCEVRPTPDDPVTRVYVDAETGGLGFIYHLASGAEDGILGDSVRIHNRDPDLMADLQLHMISCVAQDCFKESGLAKREVMRRLKTSAAQLYRLLDQTNYKKSMKQVVSLIYALGYDVSFEVKKRDKVPAPK